MINQKGLDLIKEFEGCRLTAYRCPAGVPTIGYGSTGPHVRMGMSITQEEADDLLARDVSRFEDGVTRLLNGAPATPNQFSAMVSLAYNIGLTNFKTSSVLRHHRKGDMEQAAACFLLWCKSKGRVLPGLVRRRKAEKALYSL